MTLLYLFMGVLTTQETGCSGSKSMKSSQSTNTSTDSSMASDSDWTQEGSTAYNNAKRVFEAWVDKGLSGGAAAGIVGWVNSEGGFAMIGRAEGHYGNSLEENSIAYGVVPSGLSYYTTEAGGGIYQFTPYTKYAPLGSPDWEDADKMNEFVMKQVANGDWNASMDMSGKNRSFRQMAEETDPQSATLSWQSYERGNVAYIKPEQKKADAQKAYDMFEGDKYKFDEEKFNEHFGTGGSGSASSSDSNATSEVSSKISHQKVIEWFKERTGKVSYAQGSRTGPTSYDCSSAVYYALVEAGAEKTDGDVPVTTDSEHDWLIANGYEKIYEGDWDKEEDTKDRQEGDIFIWGPKGESGGDNGHTGVFVDGDTIIHCSGTHNGIAEDNYAQYKDRSKSHKKVYIYRIKNGKTSKGKCKSKKSSKSMSNGEFAHLFDERYVTIQAYGFTPWSMSRPDMYPNGKHTGIDLGTVVRDDYMTRDIPVYAMADGEVTESDFNGFNGNWLIQTLPDGAFLYYGHLRDLPKFKVGETVKKGDVIGYLGTSGSAQGTTPHVHLEYKPTMAWHTMDGKSDDDPSFMFKDSGSLESGEEIDPATSKKEK